MTDSGLSSSSTSSSISLGAGASAVSHLSPTLLSEVDVTVEHDEKAKALIEFITSRWEETLKKKKKNTFPEMYDIYACHYLLLAKTVFFSI